MSRGLAEFLVTAAELYAGAGLLLGIAVLLFGIERLEPSMRGAYAVRPLLLPGLALFWPLVALRWARALRQG